MNDQQNQLSMTARRAAQAQDWATVDRCAGEILQRDSASAEGHFLKGLVLKVARRPALAASAFERVLEIDENRYDAAVELASQYSVMRRNGDAAAILGRYENRLGNSPMYLDLAGTVYTEVGLPEKAWPLYQQAITLQPGVDLFQANFAACSVYVGKIDAARTSYEALLKRFPGHRGNHYQLSRLAKARDDTHVEEMKKILNQSADPPDKNIFMYYAIAKELEDLKRWDEAFAYYQQGGNAVMSVANYKVEEDIHLIDTIIQTCSAEWLADGNTSERAYDKTPVFIVGLPRTGTTLTERIISSHSLVESLGETQFLQMVLRRESGVATAENINAAIVEGVAGKDMAAIAEGYLNSVQYRLGDAPFFIDKLPLNFLFLGFIAKAFPAARIVHLRRHPMDACFSMYKQVFTWAYKFSYSLDLLGAYYVAHERLRQHWASVLGPRLIEVQYESLVREQEPETRRLLSELGLPFEQACLEHDRNTAPSATASSVQIRGKVNAESVNKWQHFANGLAPLREHLKRAGINVD